MVLASNEAFVTFFRSEALVTFSKCTPCYGNGILVTKIHGLDDISNT